MDGRTQPVGDRTDHLRGGLIGGVDEDAGVRGVLIGFVDCGGASADAAVEHELHALDPHELVAGARGPAPFGDGLERALEAVAVQRPHPRSHTHPQPVAAQTLQSRQIGFLRRHVMNGGQPAGEELLLGERIPRDLLVGLRRQGMRLSALS